MSKPAAQKMGLTDGMRTYVRDAPHDVLESMGLPRLDVATSLSGDFDYLHLFVDTRQKLGSALPKLAGHLAPTGMLWVSWPKRRAGGGDLSLHEVIRIGDEHSLVESTTISIDTRWSAIKFTHPKVGKVYRNRYGRPP